MKPLLQLLAALLLASSVRASAQTYTFVDLGSTPYTDTFAASGNADRQVGYGLVGGQPQALLWQNTAASATALPSAIPQPLGPSSANMVVIGDSITAGVFGFPQNASTGYPAVMQGLGMGQNGSLVYNLGMPGEKTGDILGQYYGATGTTSVSTVVTTTGGSATAMIGDATGISAGMSIGTMGIPPNTTISAVSGTTITLSQPATSTKNAVTCSIATPVQDISPGPGYYPGGAANSWSNFTNTAHQLSYAISGRPTYVFILAGANDVSSYGNPWGAANLTTTAGQTTATLSGSYSSFHNGDVLSGANLPSNPPPYIVSGGGTATLTLSAVATVSDTSWVTPCYPTTSLATLEANYAQLVAAAHADGNTVANGGGVIAMTLLPQDTSASVIGTANNVQVGLFNAWIKSGASGADYVFDTNSALPPFGYATSSAYYFSDMLHLSGEGTTLLGNYINRQFFAQVDTSATGYQSTKALGIYSTFAAGYGINPQNQTVALLWNGLTQQPVNLNPSWASSSVVNGIYSYGSSLEEAGTATLTGTGQQVAVIWRGTASGASNANPSGASSSQIFATAGTFGRVGSAVFSGVTHAYFWSITNGNVDLHPTGALRSEALGIGGYYAITTPGQVEVGDYTTSGGAVHACLWTGTAASMVDLHPASGYTSTTATGVVASYDPYTFVSTTVGYGTKTNGTTVVLLWNGKSNIPTDLSTYLPTGTTSSRATAIDSSYGTIIGTAIINGSNHAFLLHLSVAPAFQTPAQSLTTIVGLPYTYDVVARAFPAPTYSASPTLNVAGLSISPTTGVISGTPTQTGTYTGTITATNANGSRTQSFSIKVVAAPAMQLSIVGSIDPANGSGLHQSMVLGPDGNFYGTSTTGGAGSGGTVFSMKPDGTQTIVHAFGDGSLSNDGAQPMGLSFGSDGALYGTTYSGGSWGKGTAFKIAQGTTSILYNFGSGSTDGANPATSMLQGTDGNFYSVTKGGGTYGQGTLIGMSPSGSEGIHYSFDSPFPYDPTSPDCPLIEDPNNPLNFYSTAKADASDARGTAFQLQPNGLLYVLKAFDTTIPPWLGYRPHGSLMIGSDLCLYGIASAGGSSVNVNTYNLTSDPATPGVWGLGTVYKLTNTFNATQTDLHNFGDGTVGNDGCNTAEPNAPLVQGLDGNFYGVTPAGGSANQGCFFQITPTGSMLVLHSFGDGTLVNDGTDPAPVLFRGPDGYSFYGVTQKGGAYGNGAIYKFTVDVPPVFINYPPGGFLYLGVPYSYTCTASGYPSPTFAVTSGALPPDLSLSPNGVISGKPTATGIFTGHVTATNSVAPDATQGFYLRVLPSQAPAIVSGPPTATGTVGAVYSFSYAASGIPQPVTFSVTAGALPSGLSLSQAGAITGTPTASGIYTGTVTATNGVAPDATQTFTITISDSYSTWATAHFTPAQLQYPTYSGPTATPQNDGVSNLLKYLFDIAPSHFLNPADRAAMPQVATETDNGVTYLTLTYRANPTASGLTVNVQTSTDLVNWQTASPPDLNQNVGTDGVTGDPIVKVGVITSGASKEFIRLNVTTP